jgi:hypothetical protein
LDSVQAVGSHVMQKQQKSPKVAPHERILEYPHRPASQHV